MPQKGSVFDWVAQQLHRDVRRFGYSGRLVVKTDGEPAAKELMTELAKKRKAEATVLEQSKPHDSKSNGRAENSVKRLECQVRTLKLALERSLGQELDVGTPVF